MIPVNTLYNLCSSSVYALINISDRKIHISPSTNVLASVARIITSDKIISKDIDKLELVILEHCKSRNQQLASIGYWINYYRNLGYTLYRNKTPVQYRIRTIVNKDYKVLVQLVSRRYNIITVGVFNNIREADSFIESTYSHLLYIYPIYAQNSLTKEFLMYV